MVLFFREVVNFIFEHTCSLDSSLHLAFMVLPHSLCCVNWFCKQLAIALALSTGWNFGPEGLWMTVGPLGTSLFARDLSMGHIACLCGCKFCFRVMRLIAFETQFTSVLHPGSLVSFHNFLIFFYTLTTYLDQVDRCLILTKWSYSSTLYKRMH
jgi:hypothetical protein